MTDLSLTERQCLVHRYLYYCKGVTAISDTEYDKLEASLPEDSPVKTSVGSSNWQDYSPRCRRAGLQLILSGEAK